jgi:hypothetical protein
MGKPGNILRAATVGAAAAMVAPPIANPFDACRNVEATECAAPAPDQHHVQDREPAQAASERAPMAAGVGGIANLSGSGVASAVGIGHLTVGGE